MTKGLFAFLLCLGFIADAAEIHKLAKRETIETVALQYLGSVDYTDELVRYNKIPPGVTLRKGDYIWIPGREREEAMRHIYSARSLVERATTQGAEHQASGEWKAAVTALLEADKARGICKYDRATVHARIAVAQARLALKLSPLTPEQLALPEPEPEASAESAKPEEKPPEKLNMAPVSALIAEPSAWQAPKVVQGSAIFVPESHMVETESGWLFGEGARIAVAPSTPPGRGEWPELQVSVGSDHFHSINSHLLLRSEGLHHVRAYVLGKDDKPLPASERHIRVDLTPPVLTPSATKPRWAPFDRLADVSCTISDQFGVGGLEVAVGDRFFEVYTGPVTVSVKHPVRVRFRGEDLAGNIGVATIDLP